MTELGHSVAVACNYGLRGTMLEESGIKFYPAGHEQQFPNAILQAHADDFKADVIISLYDAWVIDIKNLHTPWIAWAPIDHFPAPAHVVDALRKASLAVAMSKFGYDQMQDATLPCDYVPHGIDTKIFTPINRSKARERLGLSEQSYIVGMVAANRGNPSRKCFPQALQAFAKFKATHKDAVLYLHTEYQGIYNGVNLNPLLNALMLSNKDVLICDQYEYNRGGFGDDYMVDIYNSCNVLLSPSMAEGFGIPIMEAQACGTPVIATRFSSMTELVRGAGGILIDDFDLWWSAQGAWQALPHVSGIVNALDEAYGASNDEENRARARNKAMSYDYQSKIAPRWDEVLNKFYEGVE